jgi:streptogramin lyase
MELILLSHSTTRSIAFMSFLSATCRDRFRCNVQRLCAALLLAGVFPVFGQSSLEYDFTNFVGTAGSTGSSNGFGMTAQFSNPWGVAVDTNGNSFVADQWNSIIRKVTPAGQVTTLVGTAAKLWRPSGVAVGADGNLYITDTLNNTIKQVTPAGGVTVVAGSNNTFKHGTTDGAGPLALFSNPFGLVVDNAGNIFVTDTGNHTIRRISLVGQTWMVTTIAGDITQTNSSGSIIGGSTDGTNTVARFKSPYGVAVDSAGNLFVSDTGNYTIRKITPVGTNWVTTTLAGSVGMSGSANGTNTVARFNGAWGLAVDSAGNLFVADGGNSQIREVTPMGTNWVVTTIGGGSWYGSTNGIGTAARFYQPAGIAVDATGTLFVADTSNNRISKGVPCTPFQAWQLQYFGCTTCPNAAADADPLGKGMSNWNQFLAGLNPTNPASVFGVTSLKQAGSNLVITWKTAGRSTNVVQAASGILSDGLSNSFSDISGPILISVAGDTTTNYSVLGGATNGPARFYRIRLGP